VVTAKRSTASSLSASWARAPVIVRLVGFSPSSLEVGAAGAGQPHNDGRPERRIR